MNSIDGSKDSALKIKEFMYNGIKKQIERKRKKDGNQMNDESHKTGPTDEQIYQQINHNLMMKAMLRYTILKIRAKISYHAFLRNQTILQLILQQILLTH